MNKKSVMPAQAGIHEFVFFYLGKIRKFYNVIKVSSWIPACAGMTVLFIALPLYAQDANPQIRVEKGVCRYVTKHVPDADVEYKPGVDVHGKKVVPADITPPIDYGLENSFSLRLTTDAVHAFGLNVPTLHSNNPYADPNAAGVTTDTAFGFITLKHGKAYLNGKPLDPAGQSQLAILCKSQKPE